MVVSQKAEPLRKKVLQKAKSLPKKMLQEVEAQQADFGIRSRERYKPCGATKQEEVWDYVHAGI